MLGEVGGVITSSHFRFVIISLDNVSIILNIFKLMYRCFNQYIELEWECTLDFGSLCQRTELDRIAPIV